MPEKTLFVKFFGESPKIKVLDILLTGRELDYSITDIAKQAGISRATFYRMLDWMLRDEVITPTRKYGRIQLYRLNKQNLQVKDLMRLYDQLIFAESEMEAGRQQRRKLIVSNS